MSMEKRDMGKAQTLDDFILFGSVQEEKDIFGQKVLMKTLSAGFLRNIAVDTSGLDLIAKDRVWKINILSRAIKTINGNSLVPDNSDDELKSKPDRTDMIREAMEKIGKWEQFVVDTFYQKYVELELTQKEFVEELRKKFEKKTS